ncbi:hypothetical protein DPMN_127567 [Dreissena polymorpha]|uniref:Uncharacterized protein n=2 Tax=Dreissena polymorpha TaxID=45954 RepID=A0A9D4H273_DREPO|nr:hypothetical protein DPMN_127567 [Dreissena polymorpha]
MLCSVIICGILARVGGESFDGRAHSYTRSFVAPTIDDLRELQDKDLNPDETPELAEFNYNNYGVQSLLLTDYRPDPLLWSFTRDSEVTSSMASACRKCMVAGNIECVRTMCQLHSAVTAYRSRSSADEQKSAFIAQHSDILCSLCKQTRDVMCTMRMCVDPERGQNIIDSGVQCFSGICRWEKESVSTAGFNNRYQAWWQPQSLYYFFDYVSKEIATAYGDLVSGTSRAINELG